MVGFSSHIIVSSSFLTAQDGQFAAPDRAHAAFTEFLQDCVVADLLADDGALHFSQLK